MEPLPRRTQKEQAQSKIDTPYIELEARRNRLSQLEKIYMDMAMRKDLQKQVRMHKLHEDEIVRPTSKPVHGRRAERRQ